MLVVEESEYSGQQFERHKSDGLKRSVWSIPVTMRPPKPLFSSA